MNDIIDTSRTKALIEEIGAKPNESMLKLKDSIIGIYISNDWYNTRNGRVALEFLTEILIRIFNTVIIEVEDFSLDDAFLKDLINKAKNLNKIIRLGKIDSCTVSIMIGKTSRDKVCNVYISCNGWQSYVGYDMEAVEARDSLDNPIGSSLSAAFGAAEIFKIVLKEELKEANLKIKCENIWFSAFTYNSFNKSFKEEENPELTSDINIDDLLLVGVGAVGMAFISTLKHLQIKGSITVIDDDKIDSSNLDRYIGTYSNDINKKKVTVAKSCLSHLKDLKITALSLKYEQYAESFGRIIEHAICTVDNDETRQELQSDLPKLLFNGATSQTVCSISKHNFIDNACLGCLYPIDKEKFINQEKYAYALHIPIEDFNNKYEYNIPLTKDEIKNISEFISTSKEKVLLKEGMTLRDFLADNEICGRLKIPKSNNINGSIGFVSAIPGILLVAELIKEKYFSEKTLNNFYHFNTLTGPNKLSKQLRIKIKECSCLCNDSIMVNAYKKKYIT